MPVLILPGLCPICGGHFEYTASSDDYHRYVCGCGAKLLIPKEEKQVNKK